MAWLGSWSWLPVLAVPPTLVVLLFPDGRFPSARWRRLGAAAGISLLAATAVAAVWPGHLSAPAGEVANPVGLPVAARPALVAVLAPVLLVLLTTAVAGTIRLLRRGGGPAARTGRH